jgi:hypothetical protein
LATITAYSQSVEELRKNNLSQSLMQLEFALHEARSRFQWSIGLQSCLMSRVSILLKLLGHTKRF